MYDSDVKAYAKEQEIQAAKLEYRVFVHDDGRSNGRQELMRDYARVLYSSSFRRLRKKDVQLYEKRGEQVIKGLFEVYSDERYNEKNRLLPPELRSLKADRRRLITDYIAGMMDLYAIQEYERYFGKGSLDRYYFGECRP